MVRLAKSSLLRCALIYTTCTRKPIPCVGWACVPYRLYPCNTPRWGRASGWGPIFARVGAARRSCLFCLPLYHTNRKRQTEGRRAIRQGNHLWLKPGATHFLRPGRQGPR
jgi:hypothetical protein